ncbi:MAG: selenoneine biosynthesis selenosugar synthase SenB [Acidobacteriota bacterium]
MRILLVNPAPLDSPTGNTVTARRWAAILTELGHSVEVTARYDGRPADVLLALHARRSAESVHRFRKTHPGRPLLLALTGTDLYGDIRHCAEAQHSLEEATHLLLLHSKGAQALPPHLRGKSQVIRQSAAPPSGPQAKPGDVFQVCLLAHLRDVKDPLRAAEAARLLPAASRVRILHAGRALEEKLGSAARAESETNPRYRWLGELPPGKARAILAASHLMVLTSRLEGGANVVSEALAASVPIAATRIPGTEGVLGDDYPGYFGVGDTRRLAELLERAASDRVFYGVLTEACRRRAVLVDRGQEKRAWMKLLDALVSSGQERP